MRSRWTLLEQLGKDARYVLLPVFVAFGLVLAAACANVSNVMLTRANARHREIGVRLALGAGRGRVVRQLMTEGLVIALLAGLAGLGLAAGLLRGGSALFVRLLPPPVAAGVRVVPLDLDHRVFLFALSLAALATLLFALVPALRATRPRLAEALRGEPGSSFKASTFRSLLVAAQVAVSLIILIPAATLIRNGAAIQRVDPGIDTRGVTTVRARGTGPSLLARAAAVLAADPRVERVAIASRRPLSEDVPTVTVAPAQRRTMTGVPYTFVSPGYFPILRIPLLRGRNFREEEAGTESHAGRGGHVAIVSAAAAAAFWPGADPIGQTLRIRLRPRAFSPCLALDAHGLAEIRWARRQPCRIAAPSRIAGDCRNRVCRAARHLRGSVDAKSLGAVARGPGLPVRTRPDRTRHAQRIVLR